MTKIRVELERPARKAGGDRYKATDREFQIYIPQDISRPAGTSPVPALEVTFEIVE